MIGGFLGRSGLLLGRFLVSLGLGGGDEATDTVRYSSFVMAHVDDVTTKLTLAQHGTMAQVPNIATVSPVDREYTIADAAQNLTTMAVIHA